MKYFALVALMAVTCTPVVANELANDDQISAAITGNTVQGGMSDGAAYSEFYDADGTIKADGYTGTWTVASNEMCFDYGEGANCFALIIKGEEVTWLKDGESAGTGTIVAGNPNEY